MDPISSIAQISQLLRSRQQEANRTNKASSAKPKGGKADEALLSSDSVRESILENLRQLPTKEQTGRVGVEILIKSILSWKFGESILEEELTQSLKNVVDNVMNNEKTRKDTEALIRNILNHQESEGG